jgi:hypothetical protein
MAKQRGDSAEIRAASAEAKKAGLSDTYIKNVGTVGFDQNMFKKLGEYGTGDQMAILHQATPEERLRYWPFASGKTQAQWNKEQPSCKLEAAGLGAFIAKATDAGDYPHVVLGIVVMSIFVVAINRVLWRPLYQLAERRFRLE